MTANMYRVGDCVYFETSSTSPYQIRRIEELNKTASGNVEAKVMCFYRRRDLPNPLIQLADKHQMAQSEDSPVAMKLKKMWLKTPVGEEQAAQAVLDPALGTHWQEQISSIEEDQTSELPGTDGLAPKQRHQAKHRELFLSRHVETLPATHIRGKCTVTLLNETESLVSYLNKDDAFFYCLVFDPSQKTLLADKGEIRVGSRYQTEVTNLLKEGEEDGRNSEDLETVVWTPQHGLSDRQIDQFLVVSRSVGTFARALDCSSSVKQPSLHMSAAAASRDITLFHAMDTLHKSGYSIEAALAALVPASGPVLCRDEMEEWSASEANLFEEALDKYGKDFQDIRQDFLPWKTLKNLVEYYYMWKTTDRYVQQKRVKAVEAESKLKQVYIPNYNKPNPALLPASKAAAVLNGGTNGAAHAASPDLCASCQGTNSSQWYSWGPPHLQYRLCGACWSYWKKYGGLKVNVTAGVFGEAEAEAAKAGREGEELALSVSHRPHRCTVPNCAKEFKLRAHLARHIATAHGSGVEGARPVMKTRAAFYLHASPFTRLARRLCRALRRPRHFARAPFSPINLAQVKHECSIAMAGLGASELRALGAGGGGTPRARGPVGQVATRLATAMGTPPPARGHEWLVLTPKDRMPTPAHVAYPKPPKAPDGSLMYERVLNRSEIEARAAAAAAAAAPPAPAQPLKRRYDELNGLDNITPGAASKNSGAPPAKRPNKHPAPMQRPSREQYAAMCARAQATGQPLPPHVFAHVNGKPTGLGRGGRRHVISWMDAPDDLYFRANDTAKAVRRTLSSGELRRGARAPWRAMRGGALPGAPPAAAAPLQLVILD
ncbi:metastasis-associated protein MTA3 isoform X4 [Plutella xylostella]|uniref:metastasis-associated protein MTA3 isoform X1 n=1 Tax=Plutella xylostella TaxID=51655 RepID=UPI002032EAAA|nr:metastasis-associated protein MTA3 isoform X1 [Plutella xylostella]XP_048486100.1 metastasis-associated protein MTA3 isoform X2 [Plutella xylostella]XP_048486101.1 metastasis-associated protein MTA3 isoform X3 [Plutella xylostella]XP_048486102.1 metastasis-associated protein MTA3 isoform X4 [Plutella xylostella]